MTTRGEDIITAGHRLAQARNAQRQTQEARNVAWTRWKIAVSDDEAMRAEVYRLECELEGLRQEAGA